jgi:glycosyltransferase involved in cell wall biosynthesis
VLYFFHMKIIFSAEVSLPFQGDSDKGQAGLGGSEYALLKVSRELARLGHSVEIYNHCGAQAGVYEKVVYKDIGRHDPHVEPADILVIFRDVLLASKPSRAKKKILWLHDDHSKYWTDRKMIAQYVSVLRSPALNRVFCIGKWQGAVFRKIFSLAEEKIYYTRNGIEPGLFKPPFWQYRQDQIIYTSMYNRGLDVLLKIFPAIRKNIPGLKLKVYTLGEAEARNAGLRQEGVVFCGTVPRKKLIQDLFKSRLLVYPNHYATPLGVGKYGIFAECSPTAVIEAQAAGVPVVASKRGGLIDTVLEGETGILLEGDVQTPGFQERMISAVSALLKDRGTLDRLSGNARAFALSDFSWPQIAGEWEKEFIRLLG